MLEEYHEEIGDTGKIIDRIIQLGGVSNLATIKLEIYADLGSQLKEELKEQEEGLAELQKAYYAIENDLPTQILLGNT